MARICMLLSLVVLLWSPPVRAQPDVDRARELGREGIALFDKGSYAEALAKLSEADKLHHAPTLVLYMARSERKLGKLMAARARYEALIAEALPADASEQFRAAKDTAYKELQELSTEIPKLLVVSADGALAAIEIDGRVLGPSELDEPVALDPGKHVVVARTGERSVRREVDLAVGSGVTRVDVTEDEVVVEGEPPPDAQPGDSSGLFVGAMVGFGVGAAGLALGAITGAMAASKADDIKSRCNDGHCLTSDAELGDEAETLALLSTIGFVISGVGAATGIVLIVIDAGSEEATVALNPTGVRMEVRF